MRSSQMAMSVNYLIDCQQCGKSIPVPPRRAGETISCECGNPVSVPALRELRRLPQQEAEAKDVPAARWSHAQGAVFVAGIVTTLIAALAAWYIVREVRALKELDHSIDRFLAAPNLSQAAQEDLFEGWHTYRRYGLDYWHTPDHPRLLNRRRTLSVYAIAAGITGVTGIGLLVGSFLLRPRGFDGSS